MRDPQRHAKLRQARLAAGKCGSCGGARESLVHRLCESCRQKARARDRLRSTGGRGVGIESTSRANGKRQAAKWRARGTANVIVPKPVYPRDSWWASEASFEARKVDEWQRMRATLLPKSVARVIDELFHAERGAF